MKRLLPFALFAAALLTGCDHRETELRVGASPWPGNAPLFVAADDGRLGPNTRMVEFTSETAALQAFRNQAIDVAILTLDEVVLLASEGQRPRVAALTDVSVGAGVLLGRPPIASLAELKGRAIAVEGTGVGGFILSHVLRQAGLAPADVTIVSLLPHEQPFAYAERRVDAVLTDEPYAAEFRQRGARRLFDTGGMDGDVIRAVVVRDTCIAEHAAQVDHLVAKIFAISRDLLANEGNGMAERLGRRYDITGMEFSAMYAGVKILGPEDNAAYFSNGGQRLKAMLSHIQQEMLDGRLISQPVDVSALVTVRPIREKP